MFPSPRHPDATNSGHCGNILKQTQTNPFKPAPKPHFQPKNTVLPPSNPTSPISKQTHWPIALPTLAAGALLAIAGCRSAPPAQRVPVPGPDNRTLSQSQPPPKPLPAQDTDVRPFHDEPIVRQALPGQSTFVQAYHAVGSPRLVVFVNRTLQGQIIPPNPSQPEISVQKTRESNAGVTVDRSTRNPYTGDRSTDRFSTTGPAQYQERTEVYLQPNQYDEIAAKSLDYEALENILTDWMRADGQVELISPTMARSRLTDEQIKELQSGRPKELSEIARELNADVLIQLQAHPTRQTAQGLEVRVVAEAISLVGGQSIGQAVVDIPPPLQKTQLNRYTRFLAEKLMDDMTRSWANAPAPATAPATQP
jgi:hypothetical protein